MRRHILDSAVRRPQRATVRAIVLASVGDGKRLPFVNTTLYEDVPTLFSSHHARRLLDFGAGSHRRTNPTPNVTTPAASTTAPMNVRAMSELGPVAAGLSMERKNPAGIRIAASGTKLRAIT